MVAPEQADRVSVKSWRLTGRQSSRIKFSPSNRPWVSQVFRSALAPLKSTPIIVVINSTPACWLPPLDCDSRVQTGNSYIDHSPSCKSCKSMFE